MKTKLLLIAILGILPAALIAQENKTIKEESTVKRIVKKEGSTVVVKEVEAVTTEKGAVIVANDENENQVFSEQTKMEDAEKVVVDEQTMNTQNEAEKEAIAKREEEELRKSKQAALEKAAAERKMLEEKEAARLKQLEENRKNLEKRGKGVGKLKKKKGN